MNKYDITADKFEECIGKMFNFFAETEPKISEYSLYFDPKKHALWFIEIFFLESIELKEALEIGKCYEIHRYLTNVFNDSIELKNVNYFINFEFGKRPINELDYNLSHEKLIDKANKLNDLSKESRNCRCCGHDFDKHKLLGLKTQEIKTLTDGWIICPLENCYCFMTWYAKYM